MIWTMCLRKRSRVRWEEDDEGCTGYKCYISLRCQFAAEMSNLLSVRNSVTMTLQNAKCFARHLHKKKRERERYGSGRLCRTHGWTDTINATGRKVGALRSPELPRSLRASWARWNHVRAINRAKNLIYSLGFFVLLQLEDSVPLSPTPGVSWPLHSTNSPLPTIVWN